MAYMFPIGNASSLLSCQQQENVLINRFVNNIDEAIESAFLEHTSLQDRHIGDSLKRRQIDIYK